MNLYYTHWYDKFDPVPNALTHDLRPEDKKSYIPERIFTKGDLHFILRLCSRKYNLVNSTENPFIYQVSFRLSKRRWLQPFDGYVPDYVKEKIIKNGLLVFTDGEGSDIADEEIKIKCEEAGIPLNRVVLLTQNIMIPENNIIPTFYYIATINNFLINMKDNVKAKETFFKFKKRKADKFLCFLSGRASVHKILMMNELFKNDLIKDNYVTFREPVPGSNGCEYLQSLIDPELLPHLPLEDHVWRDRDTDSGTGPIIMTLEALSQCKLMLHNDNPTDNRFNNRDLDGGADMAGIYSCILSKKPFILHGSTPRLKIIKKLGFKTFESIWSECYDSELDEYVKAKKIVDLVLMLRENQNLLEKTKDILEFNYNHFFKLDYNKKIVEYLDNTLAKLT